MKKLTFSGNNYKLGHLIGDASREIFSDYIKSSKHFEKLLPWRNSEWLTSVAKRIETTYPDIYSELQGIADGCQQDVLDILLWNCRGDLLPTGPEGCTSIAVKHADYALLSHNEDGDPNLRQHCFLLDATLDCGTRFLAFVYPGSIPGHTLAVNNHGLAYTVNNIRLTEKQIGIPRMITARCLIGAKDLEDFLSIITNSERSGGFHYTVADTKTRIPVSVEAPFHGMSAIKALDICAHANHLIHQEFKDVAQLVTHSSRCRQDRLEQLIKPYIKAPEELDEDVILKMLQDTDAELPIYRMSEFDPDEENTLATVTFVLKENGVDVKIYNPLTFEEELSTFIN